MIWPKSYMNLQEAVIFHEFAIKHVQSFVEVGLLHVFIPLSLYPALSSNTKDRAIFDQYGRIVGPTKWCGNKDLSGLAFQQVELSNLDGDIVDVVQGSFICLPEDIMLSSKEIELLRRDNPILSENIWNDKKKAIMTWSNPYMTLQEAAVVHECSIEQVKLFVKAGFLHAFIPLGRHAALREYESCRSCQANIDEYGRAKGPLQWHATEDSLGLVAEQVEIQNLAGEPVYTVLGPFYCMSPDIFVSSIEMEEFIRNARGQASQRSGKSKILEINTYAEALKARGIAEHVVAFKLLSKYDLTNYRLGRLVPANPDKEISKAGYTKRGKDLRKKIKENNLT